MSGTYKAVGINLKSSPIGEADRLLTVLTEEYGLLRAVAPGSRKHKSSLGGRSSLFVVNQLLIAKGRTLDKIVQAETLESFPGISQNLCKLTAAQYLAELTLFQALSEHNQKELFCLLREHLGRIEQFSADYTLPSLTHATFHLLALAGLTPQLYVCGITQRPITAETLDQEPVGFSVAAGGTIRLNQLDRFKPAPPIPARARVATAATQYQTEPSPRERLPKSPDLLVPLDAIDLTLLQQLTQPHLIENLIETRADLLAPHHQKHWLTIERALRHYAQYHFDRPIRSATLIDACFPSVDAPFPRVNHDAIV